MADVVTALVKGSLAFSQARAGSLVGTTFKDAGALATALKDGAKTPDLKARLEKLVQDVKDDVGEGKAIAAAVKPHAAAAAAAAGQASAELGAAPFTLTSAGRVATELANVLIALDRAITVLARTVAHMDDPDPAKRQPAVEAAILGIAEPWAAPFRGLGAGAGQAFNALAKQLLGVDDALGDIERHLTLDRAERLLRYHVTTGGERAPAAGFPAFTVSDVHVDAFLSYKEADARFGVRVSAVLKPGLLSDKLLEKVIPGQPPAAESKPTVVQLDSRRGLSLGDGGSNKVMLPFHFAWPGVELRDMALAVVPENGGGAGSLELTTTLAGKLGDAVGVVVQGGGVVFGLVANPAPGQLPLTIGPRLPDAAGMRVDAGVARGGGFLFRRGDEYGGVLDLQLAKIGITAIGFVSTEPFSLVLVMAVRFFPAIELGLGFTLSGLGGILALERRVSTDELRRGIKDHTAEAILFPSDPVANAPTILEKLRAIFPEQPGGFVVGPIGELAWGSQAKFVTAKIGVVISLPDPKLILLGAVRVAVPAPEVAVLDLRADVYGEITPEHLLLLVGLSDSKVAGIPISGDMGLLVVWAGDPEFAITVGGFHPRYAPPPELTGLRRVTIDMSPASFVKLHAEGYMALTSNTLQFGVSARLVADVGPAVGKAWLDLDALFRWAPRFYFEVDLSAGISIEVFGESFASVSFTGRLEGTTPWMLQGAATLDVWWLPTVHFDLGPIRWGEADTRLPAPVSPLAAVAQALESPEAWTPQLPEGTEMLVRFVADEETPLLVHPLGALEVKQIKVPLETTVDRIGRNPVSERRINLGQPLIGGVAASAVSHVMERFAPGQFLALSDDQQLSRPGFEQFPAGVRLATAAATAGPAVGSAYEWETVFPHEEQLGARLFRQSFSRLEAAVLRSGPVARAARERQNAYMAAGAPVELTDAGQREVRRRDDLGAVAGAAGRLTTTAAARVLDELGDRDGAAELELVAVGVGR